MNIGGLGKLTNPGTILDLYRLAGSNLIRNPLPVFHIDIAANRHGKSQGISPPGKLCHLASPHDPDYSRVQSSFLRRPRNTKQAIHGVTRNCSSNRRAPVHDVHQNTAREVVPYKPIPDKKGTFSCQWQFHQWLVQTNA